MHLQLQTNIYNISFHYVSNLLFLEANISESYYNISNNFAHKEIQLYNLN